MKLEDFEKESRYGWISKEPVTTAVGDLFVELNINDRAGPPDETMLKLADELAGFAQTHGDLLLSSIYDHYCNAEKSGHLDFWDVPKGLSREQVLSEVELIHLSVCRDKDAERAYASYIYFIPNWEQEHALYLRCADGQLTQFDPMAGEMHR